MMCHSENTARGSYLLEEKKKNAHKTFEGSSTDNAKWQQEWLSKFLEGSLQGRVNGRWKSYVRDSSKQSRLIDTIVIKWFAGKR